VWAALEMISVRTFVGCSTNTSFWVYQPPQYLSTNIEVPSRRLEDKIRHLCILATVAKDGDAWLILSELRLLIRQHIDHLRMVAAGKLSGAREGLELALDQRAVSEIGENAARILKYQLQNYIKHKGLELDVFFRGTTRRPDNP